MNFGLNNLFGVFCTVWGQKNLEKTFIYVLCDCVDFSIYLVLILGVLFPILILFLELGHLGVVYDLIFF